MTSSTEISLAKSLRLVLDPLEDGNAIAQSKEVMEILNCLEWYIPRVIREVHPNCESLDGILPALARKTAPGEMLLTGFGILFPDKSSVRFSVAPFHLQLQIGLDNDEVTWLECRFGEREADGLKRIPYGGESGKKLIGVVDMPDEIDWFYKVTFGERRKS